MTGATPGVDQPLTWIDRGTDTRLPLDRAVVAREARGHALALGAVVAAILFTRVTWPLLSPTPFAALVAAIFVASRWTTETASIVAIVAAALGAGLMVPPVGPPGFQESALMGFVGVSFLVNRIVIGRNTAEAALRASESQFRAAWENSAMGAALLDARGTVERINPAMERTLGFASSAWRGASFTHFVMADETKDARVRFAAFMSGERESYQRENRFRRADGTTIWGRMTMSAIHGRGGERTAALMVIEDVSRRHSAEEHLRASEARYRALFDDVPVGLFQVATDGRIVMANRALLRMLGHQSTDGLRDVRVADLIATREGQALVDDAVRAGRNLCSLLAPLSCRDALMMVTLELRVVRDGSGAVGHYDGTVVEAPKGSIAVPATGM